jgi:hypothetical protein
MNGNVKSRRPKARVKNLRSNLRVLSGAVSCDRLLPDENDFLEIGHDRDQPGARDIGFFARWRLAELRHCVIDFNEGSLQMIVHIDPLPVRVMSVPVNVAEPATQRCVPIGEQPAELAKQEKAKGVKRC